MRRDLMFIRGAVGFIEIDDQFNASRCEIYNQIMNGDKR